jgi:hypothetical protein
MADIRLPACRLAGTLLICKFGAEIVALALTFSRRYAIIYIANGTMYFDKLNFFTHTFILSYFCPFVFVFILTFLAFSTRDSHCYVQ